MASDKSKSAVAWIVAWSFLYCSLVTLCMVLGCETHSTTSYAVMSSVGVVVCCIGFLIVHAIYDEKGVAIWMAMWVAVMSGIFGGFGGFVWDNQCALQNGKTLYNASASDIMKNPEVYKYYFNENVYILDEFVTTYTSQGSTYYIAPVVDCEPGTSPENTTCPSPRKKTKVGFYVIDYAYLGGGPSWANNGGGQAVRKKSILDTPFSGYYYARSALKTKISDSVNITGSPPNLWWTSVNHAVSETRSYMLATTIIGFIVYFVGAGVAVAVSL
jgi:hypothetical protein